MAQVIRIDDFKQELNKAKRLRNNLKNSIPEQYRTIGEMLSICEASTLRVGVPWLAPNKDGKELNKKFFYPLNDFVKSSLLSVQTETLINYCEDLSALNINELEKEESNILGNEDNKSLNIPNLKAHQRYYFCFVVLAVLFSSSTFISLLLNSSFSAAIVVSVVTSIPASLLAIFPCLEVQRRVSFYILLSKEISRRQGTDSTGGIGVVAQGT